MSDTKDDTNQSEANADCPQSECSARIKPQTEEELLDTCDEWHDKPEDGIKLHEYLGWTREEYKRWVETHELP